VICNRADQWLFPGTPVSSTKLGNKIESHDKTDNGRAIIVVIFTSLRVPLLTKPDNDLRHGKCFPEKQNN
jgi:hypothetical protein